MLGKIIYFSLYKHVKIPYKVLVLFMQDLREAFPIDKRRKSKSISPRASRSREYVCIS